MMMPGARWVCDACSKVTYTKLGAKEANCQHCGHHMCMSIVADYQLIKPSYRRLVREQSCLEAVLYKSSDPVSARLLALSTAGLLTLGFSR